MNEHVVKTRRGVVVEDPPLAKLLFSDTRLAPVWAVIRVLLGLAWLEAGPPGDHLRLVSQLPAKPD